MIVSVGDIIINLDQVREIERAAPKPPLGLQRVRVTWNDGSATFLDAAFNSLESHCGRVIPAPAGYQVIVSYKEDEKIGFFQPSPVIAFRVTGSSYFDVVPITVEGEPEDDAVFGLMLPDGRVMNNEGYINDSLEEWKRLAEPSSKTA